LIKDFVENKNLNPRFERYDEVISIEKGDGPDGEVEIPVFPDVPSHYAVVNRIRATQEAA
jgi:hypothetical protein